MCRQQRLTLNMSEHIWQTVISGPPRRQQDTSPGTHAILVVIQHFPREHRKIQSSHTIALPARAVPRLVAVLVAELTKTGQVENVTISVGRALIFIDVYPLTPLFSQTRPLSLCPRYWAGQENSLRPQNRCQQWRKRNLVWCLRGTNTYCNRSNTSLSYGLGGRK